MDTFFDIHLHAMHLSNASFTPLIQSIAHSPRDYALSMLFSPSYMRSADEEVTPISGLKNTMSLFERSVFDNLSLFLGDLKAEVRPTQSKQFLSEKGLTLRGKTYPRFAMSPLCIDFSLMPITTTYYATAYADKISPFADETLAAIARIKEMSEFAMADFYPFFGINPASHSLAEIKAFLHKYLSDPGEGRFCGVKWYPPLGCDPYPLDNKEEWEKTIAIYEFLCENDLPLITHCDNQGFRTLPAEAAWHLTDPARWERVLKMFPTLRLDLAHTGYQYQNAESRLAQILPRPSSRWVDTVFDLFEKYPNVYSDVSFSYYDPAFLAELSNRLGHGTARSRIMFGTDFSVAGLKVSSYNSSFCHWEACPLSDSDILEFSSVNPARFLGQRVLPQ